MRHFIITIVCIAFTSVVFSQQYNWELKFIGLGWHPEDETAVADYMPLKFDDEGKFMLNLGLTGSIERYFRDNGWFSLEFMGALYLDCALQPDAIMHLGFRGNIIKGKKHNLNGGIGPTILIRKNWSSVYPDYDPSGYFNGDVDAKYQWKFYWYGGELEYNYLFDEYNRFSVSLIPGFPKYVVLFFGYERKLKFKKFDHEFK